MNRAFTIGVAGHVDHGKTSLVRALTGIDTDRKAEEKARGLSMEAGVAALKLPSGRSVALIDVPGHTDFLKNTIRGLNSVDMAILVVAADDGVMPQTREHVDIFKSFNTVSGLVVLSKIDLVDEETLELAELELSELLGGTCFDRCPILKYTRRRPELGAEILYRIDERLNQYSPKKPDPSFRMWIDQVRSIRGRGTVVSGTVVAGILSGNDEIELLPSGIKTRARSLESHACAVTRAAAGQRVGINLHRIPLADVSRGMSLGTPGAFHTSRLLNTEINASRWAKKGIQHHQRVKVYLGTSVTHAMVVLMECDGLNPGETGLAQIRLMQPVAALPQDAFVISPLNFNTVIAGGRVLETTGEKYRAVKAKSILPVLSALQKNDVEAYIEMLFENEQGRLFSAKALSQMTGLPPAPFERTINSKVQKGEWVYLKGRGAIARGYFISFRKQLKATIAEAFIKDPMKRHMGISEVAARLDSHVDHALLKMAIDDLCNDGDIVRRDGGYRPADDRPSLNAFQEKKMTFLLDHVQAAGLTPVSAAFFRKQYPSQYGRADAARMFDYLYRQKQLVRLGNHRFLSLNALAEIKKRVTRAIRERGHVTVGDCKELFGYGRSVGAHVLDYLNQIGFTDRREDKHYLKEDRPR